MNMIRRAGLVMLAVAALAVVGCNSKESGDEGADKGKEHPAEGQKPKDHPAH